MNLCAGKESVLLGGPSKPTHRVNKVVGMMSACWVVCHIDPWVRCSLMLEVGDSRYLL
jgi:hypothetical protein